MLVSKTDAQNRAVSYSYNGGLIQTRAWARLIGSDPVTLTNTYNGYGEIVRMDYSDGTPAVEFNEFNRRGLPESIVDGAGTLDLDYDHANRLTTAAYSAGVLAGITVSNHFDSVYGRDGLSVLGADTELHHGYSYDSYGRLSTLENGAFWAAYGYLPNSDLLQTTTCRSNSTPILTTTRSSKGSDRRNDSAEKPRHFGRDPYSPEKCRKFSRARIRNGAFFRGTRCVLVVFLDVEF